MAKDRILITVKTYPTLSESYGELVCTAGVREDGSWVRLYPVPFRRLDYENRYRKFQWIEAATTRNVSDSRPESFRLIDPDDIAIGNSIGTQDDWRDRRELLLDTCKVYDRLDELIKMAHSNLGSLAVYKPYRLLDFICEPTEREWNADKVAAMQARMKQDDMFSDWSEIFTLVPKLPWKFSYRFADVGGKQSTLQILDWELGMLYWNCLKSSVDEKAAIEKVRQKYCVEFQQRDLHFFMGTTLEFHRKKAPNPWQIVGVFPAPFQKQSSLF